MAARSPGFLYGTNFSIGVQTLLRLARELALGSAEYAVHIAETHHAGKQDAPSGTALSIQQTMRAAAPGLTVEISSAREGDAAGVHVIEARSGSDVLTVRHESLSRRGFAEGAVRGAEWLSTRTGCYDFSERV